MWALFAQVCVLARVPFSTLRIFSFLPLLATGIVHWRIFRTLQSFEASASDAPSTARGPSRFGAIRLGAPLAIAAIYAVTRLDWVFWLLATGFLTTETWLTESAESAMDEPAQNESRLESGALLGLCVLAALLTAGANRPDYDDAYFLNVAAAAVEFPDVAPQTFDALHRAGLPPVEQVLHLPQVYEILVGLLSSVTGVP